MEILAWCIKKSVKVETQWAGVISFIIFAVGLK